MVLNVRCIRQCPRATVRAISLVLKTHCYVVVTCEIELFRNYFTEIELFQNYFTGLLLLMNIFLHVHCH